MAPSLTSAYSSESFYLQEGHLYDDWGIFRTTGAGANGFLGLTSREFNPVITQESLGENLDTAWELGEKFARNYPDRNQRAEQIFHFVRDRVVYVSDEDQFGEREFAQNADEVAGTIVDEGRAMGDCEDSAILLAVLYKAAGFRSAMVLMPGHVATLVFLPEYQKALRSMTLSGEKGWVWGEATGATNPFGWIPEGLNKEEMIAREVTVGNLDDPQGQPEQRTLEMESPANGSGSTSTTGVLSLLGTVGLLGLMARGRGSPRRFRRWM
ncbi:hypothetical protein FIM08_03355 [SAR202 cluster bacterium AC-647-N09_OGT_505m]|nr:hypothetical protein [SAR202 cluster bacterium AC-647-N09_OGT_505m]